MALMTSWLQQNITFYVSMDPFVNLNEKFIVLFCPDAFLKYHVFQKYSHDHSKVSNSGPNDKNW